MTELRVSEIAADSRCSRRRSAGGDGGTTLFRSARSDEDGGNPANIAIKQSAMREQLNARAASVGNRAPPHGGRREQRRSSSASDDDGGGFQARCASSSMTGCDNH